MCVRALNLEIGPLSDAIKPQFATKYKTLGRPYHISVTDRFNFINLKVVDNAIER